MKRCVIIGSAPSSLEFIKKTVNNDDFIICADGGQRFARAAGFTPSLVVGDFDSSAVPGDVENVIYPNEKDQTDMELAVNEGINRGYGYFLILGCLGGRFDHSYANLQLLVYLNKIGLNAALADENNIIMSLRNTSTEIPKRAGCKISIFAWGGDAMGVSIAGVKYPLKGHTLLRNSSLGVSNEFRDDTAQVSVENGTILVIISRDK